MRILFRQNFLSGRFQIMTQDTLVQPSVTDVEAKLTPWQPMREQTQPPGGWLKTVRQALGMKTAQAAKRAGLSEQDVLRIEAQACDNSAQFEEVKRLADAIGCDVVWGLVPKQSLKEALRNQARCVAEKRIISMVEMMAAHGHPVAAHEVVRYIDEFSEILLTELPHTLWDVTAETP